MTYVVERLAELRKHLRHLRGLQPRVPDAAALEGNLSLHNDVLYSLLSICQLVIDISGELSSRKERAFADYTESVRNLRSWPDFDQALVEELERLPGFRNVLIHEYVAFDLERAVEALRNLEPVERFAEVVAAIEAQEPHGS